MQSESSPPPTQLEPEVKPPPPKIVEPSDFVLYKPTTLPQLRLGKSYPISDDDLIPTSDELKAMQATLTSRRQNMITTPARMEAARQADAKAKRERFPETKARIRFIDGTQLEKTFPSGNKIRSIYAFVRSCLREDVKPIKFVLYEPPKRELKVSDATVRDQTLADLQLVPSCLLLVRFEDDSLNHTTISAPLSPFVLSHAVDKPIPQPPPQPQAQAPPRQALPTTAGPSSSAAQSGEKKIPKWLKLGQKK